MRPECSCEALCALCRDVKRGAAFRARFAKVLGVEGGSWPCPHGKQWGWKLVWWRRLLRHLRQVWCKPSRGFGDTVAKVTKTLGVEPCSACAERQENWNERFSYGR